MITLTNWRTSCSGPGLLYHRLIAIGNVIDAGECVTTTSWNGRSYAALTGSDFQTSCRLQWENAVTWVVPAGRVKFAAAFGIISCATG